MRPLTYALTILLGVLLIVVITPVSQVLTYGTVSADVEVGSPVGWAVGLVFSLSLGLLPIYFLSRWRPRTRPHLVILFAMLTVAAPVMNLGLVRPTLLNTYAVFREYLHEGNSTYRTVFRGLDPDWFPVVPTVEGTAYNMSARLLNLLDDPETRDAQKAAQQAVLTWVAQRVAPSEGAKPLPPVEELPTDRLGVDEVLAIRASLKDDPAAQKVLEETGLGERLIARGAAARGESDAAAAMLAEVLPRVSEFAVSRLAVELGRVWHHLEEDQRFGLQAVNNLEVAYGQLNERERAALDVEVATLREVVDARPRWERLRVAAARLSAGAGSELLRELDAEREAKLRGMSQVQRERSGDMFMFRLTRDERRTLMAQGRKTGEPSQNLAAFYNSVYDSEKARASDEEKGWGARYKTLREGVPWSLWVRPVVFWSTLFCVIFLWMMCGTEWLRRKWVERENLAFPLVDIADGIIRPDVDLQAGEEGGHTLSPPLRKLPVDPLFLVAAAVGALLVGLDAAFYYGLIQTDPGVYFDVSGTVLQSGLTKEMNKVFMVISPIVVGITFLISLELSFSIWAIFLIYTIVEVLIDQAAGGITDPLFFGWAGGKLYPFPMEQLLGASVCFAAILFWKLRPTGAGGSKGSGVADGEGSAASGSGLGTFVPGPVAAVGLVVLPLGLLAMLWGYGVTGVGGLVLLLVAGAVLVCQAVASARVRAETGLPTHHVSYEFMKLPMILGLTALAGAEAFGSYVLLAFIPLTMLTALLPQLLENVELSRRHGLAYAWIAGASAVAFPVAVVVGMVSFLAGSYYWGSSFFSFNSTIKPNSPQIATYALYSSHFLGEAALDKYSSVQWIRVAAMAAGFGIFAVLSGLRSRILRFPLHPIGYLVLLLSVFYSWVSPYPRGDGGPGSAGESSWLWGSVLVAWTLKKLVIKYGGIRFYKKAKPAAIGLVVGAVFCIFVVNMIDWWAETLDPAMIERFGVLKVFVQEGKGAYSPRFY